MTFTKEGPVIAIDGPAGVGKSSVTSCLAERLNFTHIDTGSLYRAVGLLTLKQMEHSPSHLSFNATAQKIAKTIHLEFRSLPKQAHAKKSVSQHLVTEPFEGRLTPHTLLYANGNDVTERLRDPNVAAAASQVAAIAEVRASLLTLQRRLGCAGKTILEGRDIGTVIFPDADIKFFLKASLEQRVKRRFLELKASGSEISCEGLEQQILLRDHTDSTRKVAPLQKAPDALEIDTSSLSLLEVVKTMESFVRSQLKLKEGN